MRKFLKFIGFMFESYWVGCVLLFISIIIFGLFGINVNSLHNTFSTYVFILIIGLLFNMIRKGF